MAKPEREDIGVLRTVSRRTPGESLTAHRNRLAELVTEEKFAQTLVGLLGAKDMRVRRGALELYAKIMGLLDESTKLSIHTSGETRIQIGAMLGGGQSLKPRAIPAEASVADDEDEDTTYVSPLAVDDE